MVAVIWATSSALCHRRRGVCVTLCGGGTLLKGVGEARRAMGDIMDVDEDMDCGIASLWEEEQRQPTMLLAQDRMWFGLLLPLANIAMALSA